jgi:hypothetical protein
MHRRPTTLLIEKEEDPAKALNIAYVKLCLSFSRQSSEQTWRGFVGRAKCRIDVFVRRSFSGLKKRS